MQFDKNLSRAFVAVFLVVFAQSSLGNQYYPNEIDETTSSISGGELLLSLLLIAFILSLFEETKDALIFFLTWAAIIILPAIFVGFVFKLLFSSPAVTALGAFVIGPIISWKTVSFFRSAMRRSALSNETASPGTSASPATDTSETESIVDTSCVSASIASSGIEKSTYKIEEKVRPRISEINERAVHGRSDFHAMPEEIRTTRVVEKSDRAIHRHAEIIIENVHVDERSTEKKMVVPNASFSEKKQKVEKPPLNDFEMLDGKKWTVSKSTGILHNKVTGESLRTSEGLGYSISADFFTLHNKAKTRKIRRQAVKIVD